MLKKLEKRRKTGWNEFLIKFNEKIKDLNFDKSEKTFIELYLKKGKILQEYISKEWDTIYSFEQYAKNVMSLISSQDDTIRVLNDFVDETIKFKQETEQEKAKKRLIK